MKNIFPFLLPLFLTSCSSNKIFLEEGFSQVPTQEYFEKMETAKDYYIIDVRTPMEYKKNHLDKAINISLIGFRFKSKISKLDNSKAVFLYCETAHRSPLATKKLKKKGFKEVTDLKNGYGSYRKNK